MVNQTSSASASSSAADLEHRLRRRQREPRRDGVPQPAAAVPALDQRAALGQRARRAWSAGRARRIRSLSTRPAVIRSPRASAAVEQRVHRGGEVRAEDQRGRGARRRPGRRRNSSATASAYASVGQLGLLGQRAPVQPVQQRHAQPADGPDLRVVHVGVDEPGQQQPAAQVDDVLVRVLGAAPRRTARGRRSPRRGPAAPPSARPRSASAGRRANGSPGVSMTVAR